MRDPDYRHQRDLAAISEPPYHRPPVARRAERRTSRGAALLVDPCPGRQRFGFTMMSRHHVTASETPMASIVLEEGISRGLVMDAIEFPCATMNTL